MKRRTIISSILAIIACIAVISGSTFALFTSESSVNIAITSGKVNVVATLDNPKLYSATADTSILQTSEIDDSNVAGELTGEFAGKYYYKETTEGKFLNNGTAAIASGTLTISRITPGDKVTTNVKIANGSNVDIQYRVKINVLSGLKLYEGLVVKTNGISLQGIQKVGNWTYCEAPTTEGDIIATIPVEVYLPLDAGNEYQDLTTSMKITVEAVQGNAKTTNETLAQVVNVEEPVVETAATSGQVITDEDQLVEVSVPAAAFTNNDITVSTEVNTTTSLSVKIEPQDTISDINLTSTQTAQSYDLEVLIKTQVGEAAPTEVKYNEEGKADATALKIKMFVGTGLTGVKLYHITTPLTSVASLADVDLLNEYYYDSTEGYITLMTNSFSEYTVIYNKDIAVETVDKLTQKSTISVYTPTEDSNVYEDVDGNIVKITLDENKQFNVSTNGVAYIAKTAGTVFYDDLAKAFVDLDNNETLTLMKNVDSDRCFLYANARTAKFDLNGFTLRVTGCPDSSDGEGYAAGGRAIKITNGTLTIENGTIDGRNYEGNTPTPNPSTVAPWGATRLGGAVRIKGGDVILKDLVMYNNDGWGNAVKLESNNTLQMNNCTIISDYGACIEIGTGTASIDNCTFVQNEVPNPAYHATCVAVCDGGTINLNASPINNKGISANGGFALFVYNSGGTINVYDGTYTGTENVIYSDAGGNKRDSIVNIYGGLFTGTYVESSTISNGYSAKINIYGGTFDHNPSANVVVGYKVKDNENGTYSIVEAISGTGTQLDPFVIDCNDAWRAFVELTKDDSDFSETAGKYFQVTTDLDVTNYGTERANIHYFAGSIDFTGHTFTGITSQNSPASDVGDDGITGIFSIIKGNVKISNLNFVTTTVTNGQNTVAAQVTGINTGDVDVVFENINTYGSVTGSNINNNGLFISYLYYGKSNITMNNCKNYANIIGPGYKSVFLGNMGYGTVQTITATNCHNYGTIISTNMEASMFISNAGYVNHSIIVTIDNCSNEGYIAQNTSVARNNLVTTRVNSQYTYIVNGFDMSQMSDESFNNSIASKLSGTLVYTLVTSNLTESNGKFVLNATEGAVKYELSFSFFAGGHAAGGGAGYVLTFTSNELANANIMVYNWINKADANGEIIEHNEYQTKYYTCGEHYVFYSDDSNIRDNVFVSLTAYGENDTLLSIATYTYSN